MREFLKKLKNDKKLKDKTQYTVYIIFFIFVTIYALTAKPINVPNKTYQEDTYTYKMNININDIIYVYEGEKNKTEITINKIVEETTTKYIYKDSKYCKIEENELIETTEEEIYGIIEYSYLTLDTINRYLAMSTKIGDHNIIYLKDIIIGSDSEEYITIEETDNKYNIDYTALMKLFNKDIEKTIVELTIE